jgi:hypothetical protein
MARWTTSQRAATIMAWLLAGLLAALALPAAAQAHGAVDPAASSYLARVGQVPQGTDAEVVDGDLRLWLKVSPSTTVVVLDYRGMPYLRFSRAGVFVNRASSMWYLNQVPARTPPLGLTTRTPPRWEHASGGHAYEWHDGRLHALASSARSPGATYIGRWNVPLRLDGVPTAITGGLYYAPGPSPVWFWPIVVLAACVPAVLRLHRPALDRRVARGLAAGALTAFVLAALARQLHGRPGISAGQWIVLAIELAFAGWTAARLARGREGWFVLFLIAAAAIWEGATLVGTLLYGFVLLAVPAFPARVVVVACLATGVGLLPLVFALAERPQRQRPVVAGASAES